MAETVETPVAEAPATEIPEFDVDGAVESIASGLFPEQEGEQTAAPSGKEAAVGEEQAITPKDDSGAAETPAAAAPAPTEKPAVECPDTWKAEAKAEWAKLPPTVQAEVRRREEDIARYVGESKPYVELGQGFEKMLKPYEPMFQQYNVNPWNHIDLLMKSHAALLFGDPQTKARMAVGLLKDAGFDPSKLGENTDFVAAFSQQPTRESRELQTIAARVAQIERGVSSVTSTLTAQKTADMERDVAAFAEDPKHSYFYEVWEDIARLMESGVCKSLDDAYDRAVWGNPAIRAKELERAAVEKRKQEAAAHARKVKESRQAAGVNVRGNSAASGAASSGASWEADLENSLADIRSRQ